MQNWDLVVMVLLGGGVAAHSGYLAWAAFRRKQPLAAAGSLLLGLCTVILPLLLTMLRG
ncbi:MAG TPA: hypothetical protein VD969_17635 [Symbiobacteriaceae bacterium]|nr:hypothetical protein [Symbiobacteriaceae bacterium]